MISRLPSGMTSSTITTPTSPAFHYRGDAPPLPREDVFCGWAKRNVRDEATETSAKRTLIVADAAGRSRSHPAACRRQRPAREHLSKGPKLRRGAPGGLRGEQIALHGEPQEDVRLG